MGCTCAYSNPPGKLQRTFDSHEEYGLLGFSQGLVCRKGKRSAAARKRSAMKAVRPQGLKSHAQPARKAASNLGRI